MIAASPILSHKISAAQRRFRLVALARGLAWAAAFFGIVLLLTALVDFFSPLPHAMRLAFLALNVLASLALLLTLGIRPAAAGMDDESVALAVERMDPRFSTGLIASVQLSRPSALRQGESATVVQRMLEKTELAARNVDFRHAISAANLRRAAISLIILLLSSAALFAAGADRSPALLARALGANRAWPARTRVEVTPAPALIAIGDTVELHARAIGYRPNTGTAEITFASGRRQTLTLSRTSEDQYTATLENVPEPFTYQVTLYDSASPPAHVDAQPRPAVLTLECTQLFPAYTTLPETRRDPADLLLLTGSRLRLRIAVNRDLQLPQPNTLASAVLFTTKPEDTTQSLPSSITLQPDPQSPRTWIAEFQPTAALTGFSLHLIDHLGLQSRNEPIYPLRLTADRPPTIRLLHPDTRQILATADATTAITFTADDDFGIAGVSLHYKLDDQPEVIIPFPQAAAAPRQTRQDFAWKLPTIAPPAGRPSIEGSALDFFVEARDNNPVSPGITASEHYQIRVVSKADKQAELIARMAASFAGIQEISDQQSKAASDLRILSLQPIPATQTQSTTQSQPATAPATMPMPTSRPEGNNP